MDYQYCCVNAHDEDELEYIIENSKEITFHTFIRKVGTWETVKLAKSLGYDRSFKIQDDPCVSYYKSKLEDERVVYFLCHSGIEYIFYHEE
jgi:hypothetical protein